MIYLHVGRLEIDWGKNSGFIDHNPLFQPSDIAQVPYEYAEDIESPNNEEKPWRIITELKEGLSKPLKLVVERLNLLGYTLNYCINSYELASKEFDYWGEPISFERLQDLIRSIDFSEVHEGKMETFQHLIRKALYPQIGRSKIYNGEEDLDLIDDMDAIDAYTALQFFSLNPTASQLPVNWSFSDVESGGWAERDFFIRPLDNANKFLIVTEGSSDAKIIQHAFNLLMPHIADFFTFVDMHEGYPFAGTGNLFNFVKGLISIAVQNQTIVIFDNDAEGKSIFNRCKELSIPHNMKIVTLPDLQVFESFRTLGPNGIHIGNINGTGAAIECFLDTGANPIVRWKNYNTQTECYQGELLDKDVYKRTFLSQRKKDNQYNYSKIIEVLKMIVSNAVQMKENILNRFL